MKSIAKVIGRLLAVMITKELITAEEAGYILEPLNEKETTNETNRR